MNTSLWQRIYQKSGLWGCLGHFAQENNTARWGMFFNLTHHKYYVDSSGHFQNKKTDYEPQIRIRKNGDDQNEILIPIGLNGRILFIWRLISRREMLHKEANELKYQLESLLLYEASEKDLYPTCLVFLYPFSGALSQINQSIRYEKYGRFLFLNGLKGSGKASFAQCYSLLHLKCFLKFGSMNEKINLLSIEHERIRNMIYAPELALLDHSQQSNLIYRLQNEKDVFIIVASVYDPKVLLENYVIPKQMADLCLEERVIIPSLQKRPSDIPATIDFLNRFKSDVVEPAPEQINISNHKEDLDSLKKLLFTKKSAEKERKTYPEPEEFKKAIRTDFSELGTHKKLKDMVMELEINAIKYALYKAGNSQNKIADFLGISRGSLQHKLRKYNMNDIDWNK